MKHLYDKCPDGWPDYRWGPWGRYSEQLWVQDPGAHLIEQLKALGWRKMSLSPINDWDCFADTRVEACSECWRFNKCLAGINFSEEPNVQPFNKR